MESEDQKGKLSGSTTTGLLQEKLTLQVGPNGKRCTLHPYKKSTISATQLMRNPYYPVPHFSLMDFVQNNPYQLPHFSL